MENEIPSLLNIHKTRFSFWCKSWKIDANAKGKKTIVIFNPNTDGSLLLFSLTPQNTPSVP